jgi:hypothetical protein
VPRPHHRACFHILLKSLMQVVDIRGSAGMEGTEAVHSMDRPCHCVEHHTAAERLRLPGAHPLAVEVAEPARDAQADGPAPRAPRKPAARPAGAGQSCSWRTAERDVKGGGVLITGLISARSLQAGSMPAVGHPLGAVLGRPGAVAADPGARKPEQ